MFESGETLLFAAGYCSEYEVVGLFITTRNFDPDEKLEEYASIRPEAFTRGDPKKLIVDEESPFLVWLCNEGFLAKIDFSEVNLSKLEHGSPGVMRGL